MDPETGSRHPRRLTSGQDTWSARCGENRTAGAGGGSRETTGGDTGTAPAGLPHKAAWSFFEPGDAAAEDWVAAKTTMILEGRARQVAAGIRRRATTYGYTGRERHGADTCADYLTAKAPHLRYDTALAAGWPIATGVIEGACRHLVKDRMDITGARWGLDGAEAVLRLRALHANGDLDEFWTFHLLKEHQRVHDTRYRHHHENYTLAA